MKATELRIGNLIINPHTKEICMVRGIKPQYKRSKNRSTGDYFYWIDANIYDGTNVTIELFEGIPLTEEWLVKFGFEKTKNDSEWSMKGFGYINISVPHCQYVHQLQNLYFALTGEELTIK